MHHMYMICWHFSGKKASEIALMSFSAWDGRDPWPLSVLCMKLQKASYAISWLQNRKPALPSYLSSFVGGEILDLFQFFACMKCSHYMAVRWIYGILFKILGIFQSVLGNKYALSFVCEVYVTLARTCSLVHTTQPAHYVLHVSCGVKEWMHVRKAH